MGWLAVRANNKLNWVIISVIGLLLAKGMEPHVNPLMDYRVPIQTKVAIVEYIWPDALDDERVPPMFEFAFGRVSDALPATPTPVSDNDANALAHLYSAADLYALAHIYAHHAVRHALANLHPFADIHGFPNLYTRPNRRANRYAYPSLCHAISHSHTAADLYAATRPYATANR